MEENNQSISVRESNPSSAGASSDSRSSDTKDSQLFFARHRTSLVGGGLILGIVIAVAVGIFLLRDTSPLSDGNNPLSIRFASVTVGAEKRTKLADLVKTDGSIAPYFSPTGERVVYVAQYSNTPPSGTIYLDGKRQTHIFGSLDRPVFSADGRVMYAAAEKATPASEYYDQTYFYIDGKKQAGPYAFGIDAIHVSPDGQHAFYYARKNHQYKYVPVIDGTERSELLQHGDVAFSPNSKRYAFGGSKNNTEWFVEVDGKQVGGMYAGVTSILFSPDSKHVVFVAYSKDLTSNILVVDGKEKQIDGMIIGDPVYSPDGLELSYILRKDTGKDYRYTVVKGNTEVSAVTISKEPLTKLALDIGIDILTYNAQLKQYIYYSADGKHFAYIVPTSDSKILINVDGKNSHSYNKLELFAFSTQGKAVWTIFVPNPEKGKGYDEFLVENDVVRNDYQSFDVLEFSPDGQYLAFFAKNMQTGKRDLVVNNTVVKTFEVDQFGNAIGGILDFNFSPDSKSMVYGQTKDKALWSYRIPLAK